MSTQIYDSILKPHGRTTAKGSVRLLDKLFTRSGVGVGTELCTMSKDSAVELLLGHVDESMTFWAGKSPHVWLIQRAFMLDRERPFIVVYKTHRQCIQYKRTNTTIQCYAASDPPTQ